MFCLPRANGRIGEAALACDAGRYDGIFAPMAKMGRSAAITVCPSAFI
ncbi:hypothetical protein M493_01437 [Geobacillus genomosp. 3]|uniref:Uncharacterized protein n=1 Tax=Geobacillus genomosp. 3 TaxID=1921421 RepID=V5LWY5_GEOG3|nr:hypothetical protein M493_01437 [Geobacillus genomosp. 3]